MEVTIIRAQIFKSQEATMVIFLHGLNRDIELHDYILYLLMYIKPLRLNRNLGGMEKKSYPTTSTNWRGKERREDKLLKKDKSLKNGSAPFKGHQGKRLMTLTMKAPKKKHKHQEVKDTLLKKYYMKEIF
ncbi:hypothetical protein CR513_18996, partial [Mucuna pruriens]